MSDGWSPSFLHALASELERIERAVDRLDARLEKAKTQRTKDRVSASRAMWVAYGRRVRRLLAAGSAAKVQSDQPTKEDPDGA